MKGLDMRFWMCLVAGLTLTLGFVACSDSEDGSDEVIASSNGASDSNGTNTPECFECTASQTRIRDSSTPCGYRCAPRVNTTGGGATGDRPDGEDDACVVECLEGFEVVYSPQYDCGFYCEPVAEGNGSEFILDAGSDADEDDAAVLEDAEEGDAGNDDATQEDAADDVAEDDVSEEDAAQDDVGEEDVAQEDAAQDDVGGEDVQDDAM